MLPSLSLPPLECCFGTIPIQAEKFRPDRKAFGSATVATTAVASTGPTPGASSSLMLGCPLETAIEISRASVISFSVATTKQTATDLLGSHARVTCTRTHAPQWERLAAVGFSTRGVD